MNLLCANKSTGSHSTMPPPPQHTHPNNPYSTLKPAAQHCLSAPQELSLHPKSLRFEPFLNFPTSVRTSHHGVSLWLNNVRPQQTCLLFGFAQGCAFFSDGKHQITRQAESIYLASHLVDCWCYQGVFWFVRSRAWSTLENGLLWLSPLTSHILARRAWWVCGWCAGSNNRSDAQTMSSLRALNGKLLWRGLSLLMGIQDWLKTQWKSIKYILLE